MTMDSSNLGCLAKMLDSMFTLLAIYQLRNELKMNELRNNPKQNRSIEQI